MDTLDTIERIASEKLGIAAERLKSAHTLSEAGIDSLAATELVFAIEAQFGVVIDATELARVRTMQDLADIVDALRADGRGMS